MACAPEAAARGGVTHIELMASAAQLPKWFVSHWWGEPVVEFLACLTAHAKDRQLKKLSAAYWVCAVRTRQSLRTICPLRWYDDCLTHACTT